MARKRAVSPRSANSRPARRASTRVAATTRKAASQAGGLRRKDTGKLVGRFALDFAALRTDMVARAGLPDDRPSARAVAAETNPALLRLRALTARDEALDLRARAPVDPTRANWTPLGPLAVPNGQTYGGARVLISGRVTAIAPHPINGQTIFIGTSRGGVWRTLDGGATWTPLGDHQPSLAIGALGIGTDNPDVLYAGTGEGNVQLYSTEYPLSSAPGIYLGIGILRSTDGGLTWAHHAATLLANESCYRIAVDRADANRAFAATSLGLCRTTDGATWALLSGGGLPAIDATVIACTDVVVDRSDATGNTVYAAFWRSGIFKSTNARAANPTFTQVTTGLPAGSTTSRISLAQSASSPERKYALVAKSDDTFQGLYRTTSAAGTQWELCTSSPTIQLYGAFTSDVNVDPTTPDVVYVSGVELYKCQRHAVSGTWSATNVGSHIHPDSHTLAFHPSDNLTIYSGNDGGIYVSRDAGATWDDSPNEGLCLLQYEAIDHHGSSDALVQGGTQDNGTQQYRNGPVHYHSADGDGGYCTISKTDGTHVTHAYYGNTPQRSTTGGAFGSYSAVSVGLNGSGLFYPPAAISDSSERMAWGTTVVNIDDAMGTGGWPGAGVSLPGLSGRVSAMSFASDAILYCATTAGQVFRLDRSGTTWTARALHAAPLPTGQWIWDVHSVPGAADTVIVAFSGFGLASHIWRGTVPATGAATWTARSSGLPDVPMYALALESATQWFVGTDIGVYRTTDGGASWANFSHGLPNTAIYDLRLRPGSSLLRAATHGRGLWELRTDLSIQHTVDVFVRDHLMDTGRPPTAAPVAAAWADPTRHVALGDTCYWWECADVKTDAPPAWQLPPGEVTYFQFETALTLEGPEKGNQNRVYVQVHNRGPLPAHGVVVKIMTAGASAGLPDLPADFWTTWPNSAGDANWTPVGSPQTIAALEPLRPAVLRWDWIPGASADTHSCMLVVVESGNDPIPAATKAVFDIATLVTTEKRAGLRNLHLVNLLPDMAVPVFFHLHASRLLTGPYVLRLPPPRADVTLRVIVSMALSERLGTDNLPKGLRATRLAAADLDAIKGHWLRREMRTEAAWEQFLKRHDTTRAFGVDPRSTGAVEVPLTIRNKSGETMMLLFGAGTALRRGQTAKVTLVQASREAIIGGSTFVCRPAR